MQQCYMDPFNIIRWCFTVALGRLAR